MVTIRVPGSPLDTDRHVGYRLLAISYMGLVSLLGR